MVMQETIFSNQNLFLQLRNMTAAMDTCCLTHPTPTLLTHWLDLAYFLHIPLLQRDFCWNGSLESAGIVVLLAVISS